MAATRDNLRSIVVAPAPGKRRSAAFSSAAKRGVLRRGAANRLFYSDFSGSFGVPDARRRPSARAAAAGCEIAAFGPKAQALRALWVRLVVRRFAERRDPADGETAGSPDPTLRASRPRSEHPARRPPRPATPRGRGRRRCDGAAILGLAVGAHRFRILDPIGTSGGRLATVRLPDHRNICNTAVGEGERLDGRANVRLLRANFRARGSRSRPPRPVRIGAQRRTGSGSRRPTSAPTGARSNFPPPMMNFPPAVLSRCVWRR